MTNKRTGNGDNKNNSNDDNKNNSNDDNKSNGDCNEVRKLRRVRGDSWT
jgi:hypothetical protein